MSEFLARMGGDVPTRPPRFAAHSRNSVRYAGSNPLLDAMPETLREVGFVDCLGEGFLVLDGSSLDQIRQ